MSEPKSWIRSGLTFSGYGAVLTLILTTLFLPRLMVWYFEPPVNPGCSCAASIERALELFRIIQIIGLILGAGFGFLLAFRLRKKPPN